MTKLDVSYKLKNRLAEIKVPIKLKIRDLFLNHYQKLSVFLKINTFIVNIFLWIGFLIGLSIVLLVYLDPTYTMSVTIRYQNFVEKIFFKFIPEYSTFLAMLLIGAIFSTIILAFWKSDYANDVSSFFLNRASENLKKIDSNSNPNKRSIIVNDISNATDFFPFYRPSFVPFYLPPGMRIAFGKFRKIKMKKIVYEELIGRFEFLKTRLIEITKVIVLTKDKKQINELSDELKKISCIIKEEEYLKIENKVELQSQYYSKLTRFLDPTKPPASLVLILFYLTSLYYLLK